MRTFVFLLLLVNIVFFGWQRGWLSLSSWRITEMASPIGQEAPSPRIETTTDKNQLGQADVNTKNDNQKNTDSATAHKPKDGESSESEKGVNLVNPSQEVASGKSTPTIPKTDIDKSDNSVNNLFLTDNSVVEKTLVNKPNAVVSGSSNSEKPVETVLQEKPEVVESATTASQSHHTEHKDEKPASSRSNLVDTASIVISPTDSKLDKSKSDKVTVKSLKAVDKEAIKKESDKSVGASEKTEKNKSTLPGDSNTCFTTGPYTTPESAKQISTWLKTRQVNATIQKRQVQATQTIWVYLSPLKSTEILKAKQQLIELGLKEHETLSDNAISLGVYRNAENAERLVNQLTSKGFKNVKTQKRYKNETSYWLSVKMSKGQSDVLIALKKNFQGTALESSACQ